MQGFKSEMMFGPISYSADDHDGNKTGMFQKLHNGRMVDIGLTYKKID